MANNYNRTDFMKNTTEGGVREIDMLSNSINDYKFNLPMGKYTVKYEDIARPDIIAVKCYNDVTAMKYWWIILWVNDIQDPFNDLTVGQTLKVPAVKDLTDFAVFNANRNV